MCEVSEQTTANPRSKPHHHGLRRDRRAAQRGSAHAEAAVGPDSEAPRWAQSWPKRPRSEPHSHRSEPAGRGLEVPGLRGERAERRRSSPASARSTEPKVTGSNPVGRVARLRARRGRNERDAGETRSGVTVGRWRHHARFCGSLRALATVLVADWSQRRGPALARWGGWLRGHVVGTGGAGVARAGCTSPSSISALLCRGRHPAGRSRARWDGACCCHTAIDGVTRARSLPSVPGC